MPTTRYGSADFDSLRRENPQRFAELAGLLEDVEHGLVVHPVVVRPNPVAGGIPYQLVTGWLAWSAALHFHKSHLAATVFEGNDLESLILMFRVNHNRLRPTKRESGRLVKLTAQLLQEKGTATYQEVASVLGCSPSWAFKLLNRNIASTRRPVPGDEHLEETQGQRARGRPSVTELFVLRTADPTGAESSVRLRACVEGGRLRFDRSEEDSRWEEIDAAAFRSCLSDELDRLSAWLKQDLFPEENSGLYRSHSRGR